MTELELQHLMTRDEAAEQILQGPLGPCPVCTPTNGFAVSCSSCDESRVYIRNNYIKACWILGIEFNPETQKRILEEAERAKWKS